MDEIGEAVVKDYYGNRRKDIPASVDIDGLVTGYLNLPIIYMAFAEKAGRVGFLADGRAPLRVIEEGKPVNAVFQKGTVVIERELLEPYESGRRRFTIAHEAAHYISDRSISTASFKRMFDSEMDYTKDDLRDMFAIEESQIDRLGAALLMPGYIVRYNLRMIFHKARIPIYGENVLDHEDRLLIKRMAKVMDVSDMAMMIRLRDEGLFERHDLSEHMKRLKLRGGDDIYENI